MVTIYGLVCPMSGEIRYIGKTSQSPEKRLAGHLKESASKSSSHKHRWLRKCLAAGLKPRVVRLEVVEKGGNWQDRERAWIGRASEMGLPLTNQTTGGEGLDWIDPERAEAYKRTMAAISRKRWEESPETRAAILEGSRKSWVENREARIAAAKAGWTEQAKAKLAASMAIVREAPEYKEAKSRSSKDMWTRKRDHFLAVFSSAETKQKQSEKGKEKWECPEKRERMMVRWTPESRAIQAEQLAARRDKMKSSPEGRERQRQAMREYWARRRAEKLEG